MNQTCVIMYGLPKNFKKVWNNYNKYLFNFNKNTIFTVSLHLYDDIGSLTNLRNNEINIPIINTKEMMDIINNNKAKNIKSLSIINSSQNIFDREIDWINKSPIKCFKKDYSIETIKNIFRSGNSMRLAYLNVNKLHNTYIFCRSDSLLVNNIKIVNMLDNDMFIQSFGKNELNNRFFITGSISADIMSICLTNNGIKKYLENCRNVNTEQLFKKWALDNNINIILKKKKWAQFIRIRGYNTYNNSDVRKNFFNFYNDCILNEFHKLISSF